jgi:CheY-like chemotaxis protein
MPRKSTLIVDDEALVRRTARSLLCDLVDSRHEAENGQQAVEKVKRLKPDLVLLDISMPVMNGLRAAYEIRRLEPSTKLAAHAFVTKSEGPKLIQSVKRLLFA